nr:MAG TPA: hypothetical protein [Caudoviricetes sp.]
MKKFWRSGMIDKKVIREREQAEYINRLERTILELRRKTPEPEPLHQRYGMEFGSNNKAYFFELKDEDKDDYWLAQHRKDININPLMKHSSIKYDDYNEIKQGDNVILEFGEGCIVCTPKGRLKDSIHYESHSYNRKTTRENINDWLSEQMRNRSEYNTFKGED